MSRKPKLDPRDRRYYDREYYTGHLESIALDDRFTKVKVRRVVELLRPRSGELILDLGCGIGTMVIHLSRRGARVIGADFSETSLRLANTVVARNAPGVTFRGVCTDGGRLALRGGCLDGVTAVDFTEHIGDHLLAAVASEVYRVLRPGGRFVVYTPNPEHLFERLKERNIILHKDYSHIGLRSMRAYVDTLVKTGFTIEHASFETTHLPLYALLERFVKTLPLIGGLARRRICVCAVK